jgi:hypothetical protein
MLATHLPRLIFGALLGGFLALIYGWLIRPVEYVETTPDSLRIDFRTDYVLMVAESYSADQDLELAQFRLAALGPLPPDEYATDAIDYALELSFSRSDLDHLNQLAISLRALPQPGEIQAP